MRVINRLQPFPLEALDGYLNRLRRANYYMESRWFADACPIPFPRDINTLSDPAQYATLVNLTGLTVEQLYAMTYHRFAILDPRNSYIGAFSLRFWTSERQTWIVPPTNFRFCPICWNGYGTAFIPWSCLLVTTCLEHHVALIDTCAVCQHRLKRQFHRPYCTHCRHPLSEFPSTVFPSHSPADMLTRSLWSLLALRPDDDPCHAMPITEYSPLYDLPAASIVGIYWGLLRSLAQHPHYQRILLRLGYRIGDNIVEKYTHYKHLSVHLCHMVMMLLHRMFLGWHERWYYFLSVILEVDAITMTTKFPNRLVRCFPEEHWNWLHQAYVDFMCHVFGHHPLVNRWLAKIIYSFVQTPNSIVYLTERKVCSRLEYHTTNIRQHLAEARKRAETEITLLAPHAVVHPSVVIPLSLIADLYELTEDNIVQLICAGLLPSRPTHTQGTSMWELSPALAHRWLVDHMTSIPLQNQPEASSSMLCMIDILEMVHWYGYSIAHVVLAIQQGILPVVRAYANGGFLSLRFLRSDVDTYRTQLPSWTDQILISANEVCEQLCCTFAELQRWFREGTLIPCLDRSTKQQLRWWYDKTDISSFITKKIL